MQHATTGGEILLAAYEGVVASPLDALHALAQHSSGVAADAPITLIGGGAQGWVWRETVQRLSGRAVHTQDRRARGGGVPPRRPRAF